MKLLLLLLLTTLFVGCKKEDENENYRLVGSWMLTYVHIDSKLESCNPNKLIDEFSEDGKYFGFLPSGKDDKQSFATYTLIGNELKLYYKGVEKRFKVIELSDTFAVQDQSDNVGVLYLFDKQ